MLETCTFPWNNLELLQVRLNESFKKHFSPVFDDVPMPNGYGTETIPQVWLQPYKGLAAAVVRYAKRMSHATLSCARCFAAFITIVSEAIIQKIQGSYLVEIFR